MVAGAEIWHIYQACHPGGRTQLAHSPNRQSGRHRPSLTACCYQQGIQGPKSYTVPAPPWWEQAYEAACTADQGVLGSDACQYPHDTRLVRFRMYCQQLLGEGLLPGCSPRLGCHQLPVHGIRGRSRHAPPNTPAAPQPATGKAGQGYGLVNSATQSGMFCAGGVSSTRVPVGQQAKVCRTASRTSGLLRCQADAPDGC